MAVLLHIGGTSQTKTTLAFLSTMSTITIRHINTHFAVFLKTVRGFSVSPVVHKKNVLKTNIRNFLEKEEYSLGAVKIYGLKYKNSDDVPVSESFQMRIGFLIGINKMLGNMTFLP